MGKKMRRDLFRYCYEIKDGDGAVVMPEWIEYFDSADLVPAAAWKCNNDPLVIDDTWLDYDEARFIIIDDIIIITG